MGANEYIRRLTLTYLEKKKDIMSDREVFKVFDNSTINEDALLRNLDFLHTQQTTGYDYNGK